MGVGSFLLLRGFQGSSSGHLPWQQAPFYKKPSYQPVSIFIAMARAISPRESVFMPGQGASHSGCHQKVICPALCHPWVTAEPLGQTQLQRRMGNAASSMHQECSASKKEGNHGNNWGPLSLLVIILKRREMSEPSPLLEALGGGTVEKLSSVQGC